MADIVINSVSKHGSRELSNGDWIIQFHVDRSRVKDLLPLSLIGQDESLNLSISTGEPVKKEKSEQQKRREGLYAKIQMFSDSLDYSEEEMRKVFVKLTDKESRKDMTDTQLEEVEKYFYDLCNPVPSIT